jgi:murein DD-endopeptidase
MALAQPPMTAWLFITSLLMGPSDPTVAASAANEPVLHAVDGEIRSSLSAALASHPDGTVLSALAGRIFMWHVDLRKEIERGDRLRVVYYRDASGELVIAAARYRSARKGTLDAFRFQASTDGSPSYWDSDGQEVPERLREGPLRSYDQITALLKDRPTHRGMDFKTPVGTPIYVHRAGTVNRVNWRRGGNGTCLEVRFGDGTMAKYLHLSAITARPGQRIKAGDKVALTGNTGRSTAPHLHYQLERGRRTIDPLDYHGTFRRRLGAEDRAAFAQARRRLLALLQPGAGDTAVLPADPRR